MGAMVISPQEMEVLSAESRILGDLQGLAESPGFIYALSHVARPGENSTACSVLGPRETDAAW